jgi:hypothetical protein
MSSLSCQDPPKSGIDDRLQRWYLVLDTNLVDRTGYMSQTLLNECKEAFAKLVQQK